MLPHNIDMYYVFYAKKTLVNMTDLTYPKSAPDSIFSFKEIEKTEVIKEIKSLDIKKGSLSSDIPTKIIKEFDDLFANLITENFNLCLNKGEFTEILKIAEVTPIYKKANLFEKDNYRPISILSNISKSYERIMHNQMNGFFINKLLENPR